MVVSFSVKTVAGRNIQNLLFKWSWRRALSVAGASMHHLKSAATLSTLLRFSYCHKHLKQTR
jgi:hypothetical protein